jgi:hypothetical protein
VVDFLRVEPCLFPLDCPEAVRRLVLGCCELLGAPLGDWCCSNAPTPAAQQRLAGGSTAAAAPAAAAWGRGGGVESVVSGALGSGGGGIDDGSTASGARDAAAALGAADPLQCGAAARAFEDALAAVLVGGEAGGGGGGAWFQGSPGRWAFVAGVLEALTAAAPAGAGVGAGLRDAAGAALLGLHARAPGPAADAGAGTGGGRLGAAGADVARGAAKALLARHRDDVLLFAAYARLEAAAGNFKAARKVYESALAMGVGAGGGGEGGGAGPREAALARVAVEFADFELAQGGALAAERAEAALIAALGGAPYRPPAGKATASAQGGGDAPPAAAAAARLTARRRFQERAPGLLAAAGGALDAGSAAMVAAAALLEAVVGAGAGDAAGGVAAARAVLRNVAAAAPAPARRGSLHHERLAVRGVALAVGAALGRLPPGLAAAQGRWPATAAPAVSPAEARAALREALWLYPHNPALLSLLAALEAAGFTLARLRRELHALRESAPGPALWLAALRAEAVRPGGRGRIRGMLELALSGEPEAGPPRALPGPPPLPRAGPPAPGAPDPSGANGEWVWPGGGEGATTAGAGPDGALAFWGASPAAAASCAPLWHLALRWEVSQGRADAARKLLLRAAHACPGSKPLWLAGLAAVAGGMGPRELSGLASAMQERVVVRTEVLEVMLEALGSEGGLEAE